MAKLCHFMFYAGPDVNVKNRMCIIDGTNFFQNYNRTSIMLIEGQISPNIWTCQWMEYLILKLKKLGVAATRFNQITKDSNFERQDPFMIKILVWSMSDGVYNVLKVWWKLHVAESLMKITCSWKLKNNCSNKIWPDLQRARSLALRAQ